MSDRTGSQIDHLNLAVPDLRAANRFYRPVLATLDIHPVLDIPATPTDPAMTGYGWPEAKPFLWFIDNGTVGTNMHLALTAPDRDHVHTFYESALEHGAHPLHPPRTRPEYHEHYYGAFVLDCRDAGKTAQRLWPSLHDPPCCPGPCNVRARPAAKSDGYGMFSRVRLGRLRGRRPPTAGWRWLGPSQRASGDGSRVHPTARQGCGGPPSTRNRSATAP